MLAETQGADVNAADKTGVTPLMEAAHASNAAAVTSAPQTKARMSMPPTKKMATQPLMIAAYAANAATVADLWSTHGANIGAQDLNGRTPLMNAAFPAIQPA